MLGKSSKWELGFVHYITRFTKLRFVISRFECTILRLIFGIPKKKLSSSKNHLVVVFFFILLAAVVDYFDGNDTTKLSDE